MRAAHDSDRVRNDQVVELGILLSAPSAITLLVGNVALYFRARERVSAENPHEWKLQPLSESNQIIPMVM